MKNEKGHGVVMGPIVDIYKRHIRFPYLTFSCVAWGVHGFGNMHGRGRVWQGVCAWQGGRGWQERRPLQRTACILLECIVVSSDVSY